MTHNRKEQQINLQEAIARNQHARQILADACAVHPVLGGTAREVDAALLDAAALIGEIIEIRLEISFLAAAAKAALRAYADETPDPLWFIRDELDAQGWTDGRRE